MAPTQDIVAQRQKTQAVLFELERQIAGWLKSRLRDLDDVPKSLRAALVAQWRRHLPEDDSPVTIEPTVSDIIEHCYLGDLLDLVLAATAGTTDEQNGKQFKTLCQQLQIPTIRNVIAHPVRPFRPCYWYQVAALATDPVILKLGLKDIPDRVAAAEAGRFEPTALDRVAIRSHEPVHNLPSVVPYESTGLIGRDGELRQLLQMIGRKRVRALAVHGVPRAGKTSIVIEAMKQAAVDHAMFGDLAALVLFRPTAAKPVATADDVEDWIRSPQRLDSFNGAPGSAEPADLFDEYGHERVIIAADDLDIVLWRDTDRLRSLIDSLPTQWQLVFASSIAPVEMIGVEVGPLTDKNAQRLVADLLRTRGLSPRGDTISIIAKECDNNPGLISEAIRRFAEGSGAAEAARNARYEGLAQGYERVLDSLSRLEVATLETAFVLGGAFDPKEAAYLMQVSPDEAREACESLRRTPLMGRATKITTGSARHEYSLSEYGHYRLREKPLDLDRRKTTYDRRERLIRSAPQVNPPTSGDPFDWRSVPAGESGEIKDIIDQMVGATYGTSIEKLDLEADARLTKLLRRTERALADYGSHPALLRVKACVLIHKGDMETARATARQAADASPPDLPSVVLYSRCLLRAGGVQECRDYIKPFIDEYIAGRSAIDNSPTLLRFYLHMLEQVGDWDAVRDVLSQYDGCGEAGKGTLLPAWFRMMVSLYDMKGRWDPPSDALKHVLDALSTYFISSGYNREICDAFQRMLGRFADVLERDCCGERSGLIVDFLSRHLQFIVAESGYGGDEQPYKSRKLQRLIKACARYEGNFFNPFRGSYWRGVLDGGESPHMALRRLGMVETKIKITPRSPGGAQLPFVITTWLKHEEFFVPLDRVHYPDGSAVQRSEFMSFERGKVVFVVPEWSRGRKEGVAQLVRCAVVLPAG